VSFQVFLTEASVRDLGAIHEEDFDEEDLLVPESRTGDDLDETMPRSTGTGVSGVSSMSEMEPDADYDTDLEMEDSDSKLT
jgi:hypothetical protein